MIKTEKEILTDIVVDNHDLEFKIKESGDDSGRHFELFVPVDSDTDLLQKLILEKIKKRVVIIETPQGYIDCFMR